VAVIVDVFNLVLYLNFWFNLVPLFDKKIQFCHFQFEIKIVNKLNYNLCIHDKVIFLNLYIKSLHLNNQIILFYIFTLEIFYTCKNKII